MDSAKDVTVNYLRSIQKDLDLIIRKSRELKLFNLDTVKELVIISAAIEIVEESEGE